MKILALAGLLALELAAEVATPRIAVHAHRGARAAMPENSLAGFAYAIAQGADVLEMDMAVTKDNVIVLSHDPAMNPDRCTGPADAPREIRRMTLAELRRWDCGSKGSREFPEQKKIPGTPVPTLDEVFAATKASGVSYNVETKIDEKNPQLAPPPEEFVRLFLEIVRRHSLESRVILQSFDPRTLVQMARFEPKFRLSLLTPTGPFDVLKNWVKMCKAAGGAAIISPHHLTVTKWRVEAAHQAGLQVIPWTANSTSQWERLAGAGVDAIITDRPGELVAWLKSKGLR